ncbi:MAG: ABC transporter permease subunit [Nitriliruptorales bacterium]|nr:ABC transporter permease subunit [Nitriliruptorales bacterium]
MFAAVVGASLPYQILTFVIVALGWELFARNTGGVLIPSFFDTMGGLWSLVQDRRLWEALATSNIALALGYFIAIPVGIPAGLAMGRFPGIERFADVYISILLVTPMAALLPIIMMAVGITMTAQVIVIFIFTVVILVVNARAGVRQVDPSLVEMARSCGATELEVWRHILLPGALPAIMTGVRIGIGRAFTGMVIVELLLVPAGVGGLILDFRGFFQGDLLYATVIMIVAEALILISFAEWLERKLTPWNLVRQNDKSLSAKTTE